MVLCKYLQQGCCRFGSKCVNEHLDVKQILKSEMETALHGKQWPLSCYGPFKDKPCLPNFIEDQSFEEMREMCYTSKQKNYYAQFHREFNRRVLEATEKMKAMPTQQMIEMAINIYDAPLQDVKPTTNIFGTANNSTTTNTNTGAFGTNVFNTNNNAAAAQVANGNYGNIFANKQQQQQQQQNSIFGQTNTNAANSFSFANANNNTNMFTQNEAQNTSNGIFAQAAQQNASSAEGIFAQAAQQTNNAGYNIFQQQPQQQPQQQQNATNAFGQNIFAQPQQQPNAFAQAPQTMNAVFAQPNQNAPANNIFANQTAVPTNQNDNAIQQQQQQQMQKQAVKTEQTQQMTADNALFFGIYSRMEDLTSEEIEAFQAPLFLPGKIPFSPPPRELVQ